MLGRSTSCPAVGHCPSCPLPPVITGARRATSIATDQELSMVEPPHAGQSFLKPAIPSSSHAGQMLVDDRPDSALHAMRLPSPLHCWSHGHRPLLLSLFISWPLMAATISELSKAIVARRRASSEDAGQAIFSIEFFLIHCLHPCQSTCYHHCKYHGCHQAPSPLSSSPGHRRSRRPHPLPPLSLVKIYGSHLSSSPFTTQSLLELCSSPPMIKPKPSPPLPTMLAKHFKSSELPSFSCHHLLS